MILRPLTPGRVSGDNTIPIETCLLGAVLVTADGTNNATVQIRENSVTGRLIFDLVTKQPGFFGPFPINASGAKLLFHSISGTGASAQIYEYVD